MKLALNLSRIDGITLLLLFFVGMPLKYGFDQPGFTQTVGMIHGVVFVAFGMVVWLQGIKRNWPFMRTLLSIICVSLPFGFLYWEKKLLPQWTAE